MISSDRFRLGLRVGLMLLLTGLPVVSAGPASAQSRQQIDWKRMQRDLDIMETILDKLLDSEQSDATGLYFSRYGVVFQVEIGGWSLAVFQVEALRGQAEALKRQAEQVRNEAERLAHARSSSETAKPAKEEKEKLMVMTRGGIDVTPNERLEMLKEACFEFLRDYADAIGQLTDNDRVTILLHFEDMSEVFSTRLGRQGQKWPWAVEVSARKRDIVAFRRGGLSEKAFRQRLVVRERFAEQGRDKEVDIMASILATALKRRYLEGYSTNRGRGMYLEGLGALFFLKGDLFSARAQAAMERALGQYLQQLEGGASEERVRKKSQEQLEQAFADFKEEVIQLVADYGHTLRKLKSNEYVIVNVDFENRWALLYTETPKRVFFKVQKRELDRYNRGQITLAQLKSKVEFQEF